MTNILAKVKNVASLGSVKVEAVKPELLVGLGAAAIFVGIVEACKATLELEPEVDLMADNIEGIKNTKKEEPGYPTRAYRRDLTWAYMNGSFRIARLYLKAGVYILFGYACILKGHNILKARNVALVAMCDTLSEKFDLYRERVIADLGEDADERYMYGIHTEDQIEVVNPENGKKKKIKNAKVLDDEYFSSPYAKVFDQTTSDAWSPSYEYNLTYLRLQEKTANDMLHSRGYLFLSEVYELIGYEDTIAAHHVGWLANGKGDNFVSFGIKTYYMDQADNFGMVIMTDFNVDGDILSKLPELGLSKI